MEFGGSSGVFWGSSQSATFKLSVCVTSKPQCFPVIKHTVLIFLMGFKICTCFTTVKADLIIIFYVAFVRLLCSVRYIPILFMVF